jgi:hypothetical protein
MAPLGIRIMIWDFGEVDSGGPFDLGKSTARESRLLLGDSGEDLEAADTARSFTASLIW